MKKKFFLNLGAVTIFLLFGQVLCSGGIVDRFPFYTGKIIPTPQQVTYYDEFVQLSKTAILLGNGLTADDFRIKLLADRITDYGGEVKFINSFSSDYRTVIAFGKDVIEKQGLPGRCPGHAEGYAVYTVNRDNSQTVVVEWKDTLGLSWAIASLNQLITIENNNPVLRKVEVYDFPSGGPKRMVFLRPPYDVLAVMLAAQFKFNTASVYRHPNYAWADWRQDPPAEWKTDFKIAGEYFTTLGIEWYTAIHPLRHSPEEKIDSKSEDDFAAIYRIASLIGEAGGNLKIMYDDHRFPMNPADKQNFGSAWKADIFFVNKLYSELRKKYPSIKILFCPPFYWGPKDDPSNVYGESRDEYLFELGQRIPQDTGIFWTGHSVISGIITREQMEWYSKRINRKPWIFQNTVGSPHILHMHYAGDPIPGFKEWYYDGFLQDIAGYFLPGDAVTQIILSDYLWNPQAYDPSRSVKEAIGTLLGPETYQSLLALNKKLSELDKYGLRVSPGAAKNISEIRNILIEAESIWQECLLFHPESVKRWAAMGDILSLQKRFLERLESHSDLSAFADAAEKVREIAVKEAAFDINNDVFLSPYDFLGGGGATEYGYRCERRLATWVYGARTNLNCMKTTFRLEGGPTSDYLLIISGQDDEDKNKCRIKITINNNTIFEGENPFVQFGWSQHKFPVKGVFLKEGGNTLSICNLEDSSSTSGPPFFILNYAVLKTGLSDSTVMPVTEKVVRPIVTAGNDIPAREVKMPVGTGDNRVSTRMVCPSFELKDVPVIHYLEVADLSGDGLPDLIGSCHTEGKVDIYYQKDGRFLSQPDKEIKVAKSRGVIAGDFDKDGRNDLAVVWQKNLSIYPGSENFQKAYESDNVNQYDFKPAYGKLSNPGMTDFMVGPVWRKWLGEDKFQPPGYVYGLPGEVNTEVVLADIDGDGVTDMVFKVRDSAAIRLYFGPFLTMRIHPADAAQFIQLKASSFDRIEDFIAADLNGNGRLDIAVIARAGNERSLLIYYQGIPGGFVNEMEPSTVKKMGILHANLVFGDINNNGLVDIVVNDRVFYQKSDQRFFENADNPDVILCAPGGKDLIDTTTGRGILDIKVVDVNNNGTNDIVISRQLTSDKGQVLIFLNETLLTSN